jgi:hypothetical protein
MAGYESLRSGFKSGSRRARSRPGAPRLKCAFPWSRHGWVLTSGVVVREALEWYERLDAELVTTPLVLAEADHLAATRGGPRAVRAFRDDVRAGAYLVE